MGTNVDNRNKRKRRIRKRVSGTAARPRLTVFRSLKQIYAQVVNDDEGRTLASASSLKSLTSSDSEDSSSSKIHTAHAVGQAIAEMCSKQGIERVVFDRNGYLYHGRIRAVAEGARKGGLQF